MSETVYDYECKNKHKFKSKAAIRAFCPKCGESTRRTGQTTVSDDKDLSDASKGDTDTSGDAKTKGSEEKQPEKSQEEKETEPERKEPARTKVIRVKRKQKDKDDEPVKDKKDGKPKDDAADRTRLIKRRRIRQRYAHPKVKGKVKTNKESADDKQNKTQNLTTWEKIRVRAGFGS